MEMNTKTISLLGVGVIALVVIAMAMAGMVAGYFTNPADPIQAQVELAQEQGPQGAFDVKIYICSPTSPVRPVGGAYRLVDGTIDSPAVGMDEGRVITALRGHWRCAVVFVKQCQPGNGAGRGWVTPLAMDTTGRVLVWERRLRHRCGPGSDFGGLPYGDHILLAGRQR